MDAEREFLRVVSGLIEARGAKLVELAATRAQLVAPDGTRIVVATATQDPEAFGDALRQVVDEGWKRLDLVVLGGTKAHRSAANSARPAISFRRLIAVAGLADGEVWHDAETSATAPLLAALERIGAGQHAIRGRAELEAVVVEGPSAPGARHDVDPLPHLTPFATFTAAVLCLVGAALQAAWGGMESPGTSLDLGALDASALSHPWQFLSATWLHLGPAHLAGNLCVLLIVGSVLERDTGWMRWVAIFTAAEVAGGLAALLALPENVHIVGASAGVWGLTGGLLVVAYRSESGRFRRIGLTVVVVFVALELVSLVAPRAQEPATLTAHAAGFAAGIAAAALIERVRVGIAVAIAGAHVAAVLIAIGVGTPWLRDPTRVEAKLASTTVYRLGEVEYSIEAPDLLGPPQRDVDEEEEDVLLFTFGDPAFPQFGLELAFEPQWTVGPPSEEEAFELCVPDGDTASVDPVVDLPWPTFEDRFVPEDDRRIHVIIWCQVHADRVVWMTAHHPVGDAAGGDALRAAMRSLQE